MLIRTTTHDPVGFQILFVGEVRLSHKVSVAPEFLHKHQIHFLTKFRISETKQGLEGARAGM